MKKANLIWMIGIFLLVSISVVNAETQIYKSGEAFNLTRECFYDGAICTGDYDCTITVYNPEGDIIIDNQDMSNQTSYYNYSMNPLFVNGDYRTRVTCTDGTNSGSEIFYFQITNTGDGTGISMFLILGITAIVLLIISIAMANYYVSFASGVMFIITGLYVMVYGIKFVADMYTRAVAFVLIGLGLLFTIVSGYHAIWDSD